MICCLMNSPVLRMIYCDPKPNIIYQFKLSTLTNLASKEYLVLLTMRFVSQFDFFVILEIFNSSIVNYYSVIPPILNSEAALSCQFLIMMQSPLGRHKLLHICHTKKTWNRREKLLGPIIQLKSNIAPSWRLSRVSGIQILQTNKMSDQTRSVHGLRIELEVNQPLSPVLLTY